MNEIYDENGNHLDDYDPKKGYLKQGKHTIHHEAVAGIPEEGHYETIQEYPNGGKDVEWVVEKPGVQEQPAWDEETTVYVYVPYTAEELAERERETRLKAERRQRETAIAEVQTALIAAQINTLSVDDATALRWRPLYPDWSPDGVEYREGDKAKRGDRLWRCLQGHASQTGWAPELAASLWTEICESHAGTIDEPIPYNGNMALEAGKYYAQDGVTYRCTRDTGNPVYNALAELVGLYVEVVQVRT